MIYYTHAGLFHCDEVAGFAICELAGVANKLYRVMNLSIIPQDGELSGGIIADIGRIYNPSQRRFDHHQGFLVRENGYPLASAGLLWKEYGPKVLSRLQVVNVDEVYKRVDEVLIQGIDAHDADNSYQFAAVCSAGQVRAMSLPMAISAFNYTDVNSHGIQYQNFMEAARFFETVLVGTIRQANAFVVARHAFKSNAKSHFDGLVIVLDSPMPWREIVHEQCPEAVYVIGPSGHPGNPYSLTAVSLTPESRELKKHIDRPEWFSGFIHQGRWIAGGNSVEELLRLAEYNIQHNGK